MAEFVENDFTLAFESVVRGHHVYKTVWTPLIGEILELVIEDGNVHDQYAVAVIKNEAIVGHAPRGVARMFYFFIRHGGSITCEIIDHRKFGCGLEVPCYYILTGKPKYIARAKKLLKYKLKYSQKSQ